MNLFAYLLSKDKVIGTSKSVTGNSLSLKPTGNHFPLSLSLAPSTLSQNTKILPEEYTQVDYIQSDGTQYINTGVIGTNNHGAEIEFAYNSVSSEVSARLFGTRNDINGIGAFCFISSYSGATNSNIYIASNYSILSNSIAIDTNWHSIKANVLNDNNVYYDNVLQFEGYNTEFTAEAEASIFRTYNQTSYGTPASAKIKKLKIYNDGTIIRDFIPCYRNSDNEVGLYDLVNDVFYTNDGTGSFTYGSVVSIPNPDYPTDINMVTGDNTITVSGNEESVDYPLTLGELEYCKIGNYSDEFIKKTLPNTYTEVDYIESSGTQRIDTGFKPNSNTKYDMDVLVTQKEVGASQYFVSSQTSKRSNVYFNANNYLSIGYGSDYYNTSILVETNKKYNLVLDKNKFYIDNELITTANAGEFSLNLNAQLFVQYAGGTTYNNYAYARLYTFKIYDNGVLVRDFIPCYRNSDNEVGLYDLVNDVFYTNSGTGSFTYGDVTSEKRYLWYLKKMVRKLELAVADMDNSNSYPGWKGVTQLYTDYPNQNATLQSLTTYTTNVSGMKNALSINTNVGNRIIYFRREVIDISQDQWKANYPNLIVVIYYGLQNPIYNLLNDTLQNELDNIDSAVTYKGETNISQTNEDLPFVITASTTLANTYKNNLCKYIILDNEKRA